MDERDVPLYRDFTALKSLELETWIAIGGFDFSNPGTPTFSAWYVFEVFDVVDMPS